MASSIVHDDIKKLEKLLVYAVHMVKSPANRKKFFLLKGEKIMEDEKLKEILKEQELSEDEIAYILSNQKLKEILSDEENKKKALDVIKESIRKEVMEIENALESNSISDITGKILKPFENITSLLVMEEEKTDEGENKKADDKKDDNDDTEPDEEFDNSVSELADEISGLAEDVSGLVDDLV